MGKGMKFLNLVGTVCLVVLAADALLDIAAYACDCGGCRGEDDGNPCHCVCAGQKDEPDESDFEPGC